MFVCFPGILFYFKKCNKKILLKNCVKTAGKKCFQIIVFTVLDNIIHSQTSLNLVTFSTTVILRIFQLDQVYNQHNNNNSNKKKYVFSYVSNCSCLLN